MRIALYGPFLFELAVGLRKNPSNEVRLFLDENTLPYSLIDEALIGDPSFAEIGSWASRRALLFPRRAPITRLLADYDVVLVTELGPVFAQFTRTKFFFIPTGWDLTCGPFPFRSRSIRSRGIGDVSSAVIAAQLRSGIRQASGIWGAPFMPFRNAVERLGCRLTADLPQSIDTNIFKPAGHGEEFSDGFKGLTIFHPTRMMFTYDPFLVDTGQWKGNDRLFRGFAGAVDNGIDARLILIERRGSPDQELAKRLIDELGLSGLVTWLRSTTSAGFTWRELAHLYRSSDLVVDTFGGWPGLVSLEALSCARPVLNQVDEDAMALIYPDGHPYLQAHTEEDVRDAISLLTDYERRASIGDAGRRWVLDNHDRDVVARRCESMLEVL